MAQLAQWGLWAPLVSERKGNQVSPARLGLLVLWVLLEPLVLQAPQVAQEPKANLGPWVLLVQMAKRENLDR